MSLCPTVRLPVCLSASLSLSLASLSLTSVLDSSSIADFVDEISRTTVRTWLYMLMRIPASTLRCFKSPLCFVRSDVDGYGYSVADVIRTCPWSRVSTYAGFALVTVPENSRRNMEYSLLSSHSISCKQKVNRCVTVLEEISVWCFRMSV